MAYIKLFIHLSKLKSNIQKVRSYIKPDTKLTIVAKANAYGLGAENICPAIQDLVDYFAFATIDEAVNIRKVCPNVGITILSEPRKIDYAVLAEYDIGCTVYNQATIATINEFCEQNNVSISTHFKLDTGLHRLGNNDIFENKTGTDYIQDNPTLYYWLDNTGSNLKKISVWSHLQNSEFGEENVLLNENQLDHFNKSTENLKEKYGIFRHIANSFAIEYLDERYTFDLVRAGIIIWQNSFTLKVQVKHIFNTIKDTTVGYGCKEISSHKYVCDGNHKAAALAIGYADGLSTRLSNKGYVSINNTKCDIISPVMMDMTIIKIPENLNIQAEDWVTFFGCGDLKTEELNISNNLNSGKELKEVSKLNLDNFIKDNNNAMTTLEYMNLTGENSREVMVHLGIRIDRIIL